MTQRVAVSGGMGTSGPWPALRANACLIEFARLCTRDCEHMCVDVFAASCARARAAEVLAPAEKVDYDLASRWEHNAGQPAQLPKALMAVGRTAAAVEAGTTRRPGFWPVPAPPRSRARSQSTSGGPDQRLVYFPMDPGGMLPNGLVYIPLAWACFPPGPLGRRGC